MQSTTYLIILFIQNRIIKKKKTRSKSSNKNDHTNV